MRMIWHAILHFPVGLMKRVKGNNTDITPQSNVDISAFMGRWYEQARMENTFEYGMDEVYSDYYAVNSNHFRVFNNGTDTNGHQHQARGRGHAVGNAAAGALKVSFIPPFIWFAASFLILYTDAQYREALIAGSGGHYLWLLTRDAVPTGSQLERLLHEAQRRGFNTQELRLTRHTHQNRQSTPSDT